MHLHRTANLVCTEVRIAYHGYLRLLVEETHGVGREACHVGKDMLVGVAVDKRI